MPKINFLYLSLTGENVVFIFSNYHAGVVEAGVGMAVGGVVGALMFKSGSGWRAASVAAGCGVAAGSTFERIRKSYY